MRDIGKHIVYSDGRVFSKKLKRFLKICKNERGYKYVSIEKHKHKSHHRLLAECFIPNPLNLDQINHINGIRDDNRLDNLEWCNSSHNQKHAYKMGLHAPMIGDRNHRAKLSNIDVGIIRDCFNAGFRGKDIARYFNVSASAISMIKRNQNWAMVC